MHAESCTGTGMLHFFISVLIELKSVNVYSSYHLHFLFVHICIYSFGTFFGGSAYGHILKKKKKSILICLL